MDWLKNLIPSAMRPEPRRSEWPDWMRQYRKPFFRNRQHAESYVADELAKALPQGWAVRQSPDHSLSWSIRKEELASREFVDADYCMRVSKGLDLVILDYGNSSAGGFSLHHALLHALVIDAVMLRCFPLSECLIFLLAYYKPNDWCAT